MFGILVCIVLLILWRERFISNFDMLINLSPNPIWTNYHAREKINLYGEDYIDKVLKRELSATYLR